MNIERLLSHFQNPRFVVVLLLVTVIFFILRHAASGSDGAKKKGGEKKKKDNHHAHEHNYGPSVGWILLLATLLGAAFMIWQSNARLETSRAWAKFFILLPFIYTAITNREKAFAKTWFFVLIGVIISFVWFKGNKERKALDTRWVAEQMDRGLDVPAINAGLGHGRKVTPPYGIFNVRYKDAPLQIFNGLTTEYAELETWKAGQRLSFGFKDIDGSQIKFEFFAEKATGSWSRTLDGHQIDHGLFVVTELTNPDQGGVSGHLWYPASNKAGDPKTCFTFTLQYKGDYGLWLERIRLMKPVT